MNIEIVHNFIVRIFGVSEVRFWIIPDHSTAEPLNEDSIQGDHEVPSTISEVAWFNADVHEITEALLGLQMGTTNNFANDGNELCLTKLVLHNIDASDNAPIKQPAHQTAPAKFAEIKKQMLDLDII